VTPTSRHTKGLPRFHSFGSDRAKARIGLLVLMHNGNVVVNALDETGRADANPSREAAQKSEGL
jgi:hypothetical protein